VPALLGIAYNGSLYFCEALKYVIFVCIFYYFLKQATTLLTPELVRRWFRIISILTAFSFIVYLAFGVEYIFSGLKGSYEGGFCHNPQFIVGSIFQLIQTSCFIVLSWSIEKSVRLSNDLILMRVKTEELDQLTKSEKDLLKSRQDTVKHLKIIAWLLWSTIVFNFIYSVMVFKLYSPECMPLHITLAWNAVFNLIDRLDSYVFWFYPLIYLFWPSKRN